MENLSCQWLWSKKT